MRSSGSSKPKLANRPSLDSCDLKFELGKAFISESLWRFRKIKRLLVYCRDESNN